MRVTDFLVAAAAVSMAATPALAAKNPAAKLSLAGSTTDAAVQQSNVPTTMRNHNFLLIGLGVVGVVILALALGQNDDSPASA